MSEFNKYSTDGGATFLDVEDSKAVHWGDQSKGYVGKNLLQNKLKNGSSYGLTRTVNSDKSVLLTGTPSQNVNLVLNDFVLSAGTYKISDGATGQSGSTFKMAVWTKVGDLYVDYLADTMGYKGDTFTLDADTLVGVLFTIYSGFNTNNKLLYPMLRDAAIPDSTYEPYLIPNTDLMSYADNMMLGAKNLLPYPYLGVTHTEGGITFTDNGDGSITVNGTSDSGYPGFSLMSATDLQTLISKFGNVRLTGAINGSNIRLYAHGSKYFIDEGNGVVIPSTETSFSESLRLQVSPNTTIDNVTIRPMLRLESDIDDTYVQYAMTNRELTINSYKNPRKLTSADDLNNIVNNEICCWGNTLDDVPSNAPLIKTNCYLIPFKILGEAFITQLVIEGGWRNQDWHIYIRGTSDGGTNWSNWRKISDSVLS